MSLSNRALARSYRAFDSGFMKIDLAGQVNATPLGQSKALLPLFEAIVNSVQAIEERVENGALQLADGVVTISIHRAESIFAPDKTDPSSLSEILAFEVTDNGIGFNDTHFNSFDTAYSTLKAERGGKGVGRLVWLKAFARASIESEYVQEGEWWRRTFFFVRTPRGVESPEIVALQGDEGTRQPSTTVRLLDFQKSFRDHAPKQADTIARRIVEHCLVMYMLGKMPKVVLRDPSEVREIDLGHVYQSEIGQSVGQREFTVEGHSFTIMDVLLRASADQHNAIHFCANNREVEELRLNGLVAHAENPIKADGVELRYAACVTGPYLDRTVNQQRTAFNIEDDPSELQLSGQPITMQQIKDAAIAAADEYLEPRLVEAKQKAVARVERYIQSEEPKYRILLEHNREEVERLSASHSDERLELELHKMLNDFRHRLKKQVATRLKAVPDDAESFEQFERESVKSIRELTELRKSELADYVVHRRMVLDFLQKMLGLVEQKRFAREDVLHSLFFPMRTNSNRVDYDNHNLWVLDERLAFHEFLASDLAFNAQAQAPVRVEGKERPDLLIYNHPVAFSQDAAARGSVVIVEFKRPERDEYDDFDNPVDQVVEYIEQIMAGQARRPDGSRIQSPANGTSFYCHVVATLTPKLRTMLRKGAFIETPDGEGCFFYNQNYNAYIEVSDYRKVLGDAVKRNKAFFERLGLHTGVKRPAQAERVPPTTGAEPVGTGSGGMN